METFIKFAWILKKLNRKSNFVMMKADLHFRELLELDTGSVFHKNSEGFYLTVQTDAELTFGQKQLNRRTLIQRQIFTSGLRQPEGLGGRTLRKLLISRTDYKETSILINLPVLIWRCF